MAEKKRKSGARKVEVVGTFEGFSGGTCGRLVKDLS